MEQPSQNNTFESGDPMSDLLQSLLNTAPDALSNSTGNVLQNVSAEHFPQGIPTSGSQLDEAGLNYGLDDNSLGGLSGDLSLDSNNCFDQSLDGILGSLDTIESGLPLMNNSPFPTVDRTQWIPDSTFGPPSEPIDIREFLKNVEESFRELPSRKESEHINELRVEDVAGWAELQELNEREKQVLVEDCSVSDLLETLTNITSDPGRVSCMRESHNQTIVSMLGYTMESIKLPPEQRGKRRKDAYTTTGQTQQNSSVSGAAAVAQGGSGIESHATANLPVPEPEAWIKTISLQSWLIPEAAKHFIRKPRTSDVNVLTEIRPSPIPFLLEQTQEDIAPRSPSLNASHLRGSTTSSSPVQHPHAMVELSILTPALHHPYPPRHSLSLALLGSQTLEDISEAIVCVNRWIPRGPDAGDSATSGSCVVIEGVVYGDGEGDADGKDYAEKLLEYTSSLRSQDSASDLRSYYKESAAASDEQLTSGLPMLNTRLDTVKWKLHKPYWYMHGGGCVHWIVVDCISLLHQSDPPLPTTEKPSNWPYTTSLSPAPHRPLCRVCGRMPATLAVSGDVRLAESPSMVCEGCWALLGPPQAGRDYSESDGSFVSIHLPVVS